MAEKIEDEGQTTDSPIRPCPGSGDSETIYLELFSDTWYRT